MPIIFVSIYFRDNKFLALNKSHIQTNQSDLPRCTLFVRFNWGLGGHGMIRIMRTYMLGGFVLEY